MTHHNLPLGKGRKLFWATLRKKNDVYILNPRDIKRDIAENSGFQLAMQQCCEKIWRKMLPVLPYLKEQKTSYMYLRGMATKQRKYGSNWIISILETKAIFSQKTLRSADRYTYYQALCTRRLGIVVYITYKNFGSFYLGRLTLGHLCLISDKIRTKWNKKLL